MDVVIQHPILRLEAWHSLEDVKETIQLVKSKTNVPLGFHGHDNLEMGLINTITDLIQLHLKRLISQDSKRGFDPRLKDANRLLKEM